MNRPAISAANARNLVLAFASTVATAADLFTAATRAAPSCGENSPATWDARRGRACWN